MAKGELKGTCPICKTHVVVLQIIDGQKICGDCAFKQEGLNLAQKESKE